MLHPSMTSSIHFKWQFEAWFFLSFDAVYIYNHFHKLYDKGWGTTIGIYICLNCLLFMYLINIHDTYILFHFELVKSFFLCLNLIWKRRGGGEWRRRKGEGWGNDFGKTYVDIRYSRSAVVYTFLTINIKLIIHSICM